MCTIDELSEKMSRYAGTMEKNLHQFDKRIKAVERTQKNIDGMLMNHVEATLMYMRSMDDKLKRIQEMMEGQTGEYTGD